MEVVLEVCMDDFLYGVLLLARDILRCMPNRDGLVHSNRNPRSTIRN